MNRLILIGNGFDLAHGLKTSYGHFIEWICKKILDELENTSEEEIFSDSLGLATISEMLYKELKANLSIFLDRNELDSESFRRISDRFRFKNKFFKTILDCHADNWSDIEAIYNDELHKKKNIGGEIKKLNNDLILIKESLAKYLGEQIEKFTPNQEQIKKILSIINSPILTKDLRLDFQDDFFNELIKNPSYQDDYEYYYNYLNCSNGHNIYIDVNNEATTKIKEKYEKSEKNYTYCNLEKTYFQEKNIEYLLEPYDILVLNFNYTSIIELYPESFNVNAIHGKLEDISSMIFGYGDEEAHEYIELENSPTKGLLNNVKSINYLQTNNYRKLLNFIDNSVFQVFTIGVSCGLADRTLLRKIFQHQNCVSIKPFYYRNKENNSDDYKDIIQNISRCFQNKDQLRERVVNKEYCMSLPQYDD